MNLKNIALTVLAAVCTVTTQANPMIAYYLASLGGDACLIASSVAPKIEKYIETDQAELIELGATMAHINQLKKDAAKISPYISTLAPAGAVLSVSSRIGMLSRGRNGIALALLSIPLNSMLVAGGYAAQLDLK